MELNFELYETTFFFFNCCLLLRVDSSFLFCINIEHSRIFVVFELIFHVCKMIELLFACHLFCSNFGCDFSKVFFISSSYFFVNLPLV